jgi:hypothetical protein
MGEYSSFVSDHVVTLSPSTYSHASYVGLRRHLNAILHKRNRGPTAALGREHWSNDIEGALGEAAVCSHFGVWWDGAIGEPGDGDIGRTEVKTCAPGGRLIVQEDNRPDVPYVLVWGFSGVRYTLKGWCWGHEAQAVPISDPRGDKGLKPMPAHFVDASRLVGMADFPVEYLRDV